MTEMTYIITTIIVILVILLIAQTMKGDVNTESDRVFGVESVTDPTENRFTIIWGNEDTVGTYRITDPFGNVKIVDKNNETFDRTLYPSGGDYKFAIERLPLGSEPVIVYTYSSPVASVENISLLMGVDKFDLSWSSGNVNTIGYSLKIVTANGTEMREIEPNGDLTILQNIDYTTLPDRSQISFSLTSKGVNGTTSTVNKIFQVSIPRPSPPNITGLQLLNNENGKPDIVDLSYRMNELDPSYPYIKEYTAVSSDPVVQKSSLDNPGTIRFDHLLPKSHFFKVRSTSRLYNYSSPYVQSQFIRVPGIPIAPSLGVPSYSGAVVSIPYTTSVYDPAYDTITGCSIFIQGGDGTETFRSSTKSGIANLVVPIGFHKVVAIAHSPQGDSLVSRAVNVTYSI